MTHDEEIKFNQIDSLKVLLVKTDFQVDEFVTLYTKVILSMLLITYCSYLVNNNQNNDEMYK